MFGSRGLTGPAAAKGSEFEAALLKASDGGRIPIVMDTSPCLSTMKSALENPCPQVSYLLKLACCAAAARVPILLQAKISEFGKRGTAPISTCRDVDAGWQGMIKPHYRMSKPFPQSRRW